MDVLGLLNSNEMELIAKNNRGRTSACLVGIIILPISLSLLVSYSTVHGPIPEPNDLYKRSAHVERNE